LVDPWRVLGIAATGDVRLIKKAYTAHLKHAHPEDDPEAFQELRQAYEMARSFARWQQANKDRPRRPPAADGPAEPAPAPERPPVTRPAPRPVDLGSKPGAAAALLLKAEQLHDDPQQRASQAAWKALLADESLWNVDARVQFERGLVAILIRRGCVFPAAVGCLLEQEFCWTEHALALHRAFPGPGVGRLIERLEQAPLEFAEELCREGSYAEARALVQPIAEGTGPWPRIAAARRLLVRCANGDKAQGVLQEVERLHSDLGTWTSVEQWKQLLSHADLKHVEVRSAFQLRLLAFLATHGQALTGPVWRLLCTRFAWPKNLPEPAFTRALPAIGTAIVEDAEALFEEGKQDDIVTHWAEIIGRLQGAAAERGRLVLEKCCLQALERGEELARLGRDREVVELIAPIAAIATGEAALRARALFEERAGALLDDASEHQEQERHAEAIALVAPVVRSLRGEIGVRARLVLAQSYLAREEHGRAEHHLKDILNTDPRHVPALLLLAEACRARGMTERAWQAYRQVLAIEPGHRDASEQLAIVERELKKEKEEKERHPVLTTPRSAKASSSPSPILGPMVGLIAMLNALRSWGTNWSTIDTELIVWGLVIAVVIVGVAVLIHRRPTWSSIRIRIGSPRFAIAACTSLICILVWTFMSRRPLASAPVPGADSLKRGLAELDAGRAAEALPLLQAAAVQNPRAKDVHEAVGRALYELGRFDEAMIEFTRQIQADPAHPRAYAWRAHVDMARDRWNDAEKDLQKQIEVAPSLPWSYEQLARRRMAQNQMSVAVRLFGRCAEIEPREARRWLDLGMAQALDSRSAEARESVDKAMSLATEDWMRIGAARIYQRLGSVDKAGGIALATLPSLRQRLNALHGDSLSEKDLYWSETLSDAWVMVGQAALARGRRAEAARYLESAWLSSLSLDSGYALGTLLASEGRAREAEAVRRNARLLRDGLVADSGAFRQPYQAELDRLRRVRLTGPALESIDDSVLLLVDANGHVEHLNRLGGATPAPFKRQVEALGPIRLASRTPDDQSVRLVRRAWLHCSAGQSCALLLQPAWGRSLPSAESRVRIVNLDTGEALPVRPGRRVRLSTTVEYACPQGAAELKLFVRDQPGLSLTEVAATPVDSRPRTVVLAGSYAVPSGASRIDVVVQLLSASSRQPLSSATAWLAVAQE
jgi:tetratricopeptide (TPR) repeat protein